MELPLMFLWIMQKHLWTQSRSMGNERRKMSNESWCNQETEYYRAPDGAGALQTTDMSLKEDWIEYIHDLQNRICVALEQADGKAKFIEDEWQRPEGGGGKTRVISNGNVFEKGGVNTSV